MNTALPERITQVRELAGLTRTDLAERLDVSLAAVSQWENGVKNPTAESLEAICRALNISMPLLLMPIPTELSRRGPLTFRATSASKTTLRRKQAHRLAEMAAETFMWLERWVSLPAPMLPEPKSLTDAEAAANECRRAWGMEDRPIAKLGELLESKGIRLCTAAFGDNRFDAFSCIVSGRPFIFLGVEKQDRARSRFDAAHELGHLLCHQFYSDEEIQAANTEVESQANAFASAFLLPANTFSKDLVDTSLEGFKRLKPKWGVSIQAMIRRARDLKLISEATYERHYRNISAAGWRRAKGEPMDDLVPRINRTLGRRSLALLTEANKVKPWEVISELPLPHSVLESVLDTDLNLEEPEELNKVIAFSDFKQHPPHGFREKLT